MIRLDYKQIDKSELKSKKLFNILKAYAAFDPDIGYVQGINYIVALLNEYIVDEQEAFWVFVQIMNDRNWRDLYAHDTPKLIRLVDVLKSRIEIKLPQLYEHFKRSDFLDFFPAVFSSYFLSMFCYNCPIEFSARIMDVFFIYEEKAFIECLLHLLKLSEFKIKEMDSEEMHVYIRTEIIKDCLRTYGMEHCMNFC